VISKSNGFLCTSAKYELFEPFTTKNTEIDAEFNIFFSEIMDKFNSKILNNAFTKINKSKMTYDKTYYIIEYLRATHHFFSKKGPQYGSKEAKTLAKYEELRKFVIEKKLAIRRFDKSKSGDTTKLPKEKFTKIYKNYFDDGDYTNDSLLSSIFIFTSAKKFLGECKCQMEIYRFLIDECDYDETGSCSLMMLIAQHSQPEDAMNYSI
jgi:hypothetical protein